MYPIIKSNYSRCNRFVYRYVSYQCGTFYFHVFRNPYFSQVVFAGVLREHQTKKKKVRTIIKSNYGRYNRFVCRTCIGTFLVLFFAWNPYLNQVVFWRSLVRVSLKKIKKGHAIIKTNYGRHNRFVAVVNVGKFSFFFLAWNAYFHHVFCRSLRWRVSRRKKKKVYTIIKSNYDRYNRVVYVNC